MINQPKFRQLTTVLDNASTEDGPKTDTHGYRIRQK